MAEPNVPAAHPTFSSPPVGAVAERPPSTIYMTPEQWAATQSELSNLRGLQASVSKQLEAAEQERLKALAEKGQIEQALNEQRKSWESRHAEALTQAAKVEGQWLGEKSNASLAEALNGRQFVGKDPAKTAAMVRKLLADEIEAVKGPDGTPYVRDRSTLRPASEYLRERLESDDFAAFFAPRTGGGSGTDGTRTPANAQQSNDPTGDYMRAYRERMSAMKSDPSRIFTG